ncbi:hypothetical protein QAD02_021565 [Eretmocerus hayati]|uniref:Uncharacterized protein n=1 Tax=Eretmocerus hayati TaxID=131215 RepID=A0ACC2PQV2_9HYME|nr:hypothetical protein QAD02_021565 [Eretmocerus hayati]
MISDQRDRNRYRDYSLAQLAHTLDIEYHPVRVISLRSAWNRFFRGLLALQVPREHLSWNVKLLSTSLFKQLMHRIFVDSLQWIVLTSDKHDNDGEDFFCVSIWSYVAKTHGSKAAEGEIEGSNVATLEIE